MIRQCQSSEFDQICTIINDAAQAYRGIIPADCWREPYMSPAELRHEIETGVNFWGYETGGELVGVMGMQAMHDVTLIRHAYVRTTHRRQGVGGQLLAHMLPLARQPVLIGTWAAAVWAIRFYEKYDFQLVTPAEKERLLRRYWDISDRQVETSVVLADWRWFDRPHQNGASFSRLG